MLNYLGLVLVLPVALSIKSEYKCEEGWTKVGITCIKASTDKLCYNHAKAKCQKDGAELMLVLNSWEIKKAISVMTTNKYYYIMSEDKSTWTRDWYTGQYKRTLNYQTKYGGKLPYTNFKTRQPSCPNRHVKYAIYMSSSGKWAEVKNTYKTNYICQKDAIYEVSRCSEGWTMVGNKCIKPFHHVGVDRSWYQARKTCQRYKGDLVEIQSKEENDKMKGLLKNRSGYAYWIGYSDLETEGSWKFVSNQEKRDFPPWSTKEPNGRQQANCADMTLSGTWDDKPCDGTKQHWVCAAPTFGSYNSCYDVSTFKMGNQCVYVNSVSYKATWNYARTRCRSYILDGDLVVIHNATENNIVKSKLEKGKTYWIGYSDQATEGIWKSVKGNILGIVNPWGNGLPGPWRDAQPNGGKYQSCARTDYSGKWADENCNHRKKFICQKPATTLTYKCQDGWTDYYDSCVKVVHGRHTWKWSRSECYSKGGDLVEVGSPKQQHILEGMMKERRHYWLGYSDIDNEGQWFSVNSRHMGYSHWKDGEPSNSGGKQHCAAFSQYSGRQWLDEKCDRSFSYICQVKVYDERAKVIGMSAEIYGE